MRIQQHALERGENLIQLPAYSQVLKVIWDEVPLLLVKSSEDTTVTGYRQFHVICEGAKFADELTYIDSYIDGGNFLIYHVLEETNL